MRRFLGEFEQLLLLALVQLGDEAYTVTIRRTLEARTGRRISPGAIYTALERLDRRGFVSSRFGDPTPERGGKRKKFYRIAAPGLAALRDSQAVLARLSQGAAARLKVR
jgi:DNA-binding PadR family transcriptional regulator